MAWCSRILLLHFVAIVWKPWLYAEYQEPLDVPFGKEMTGDSEGAIRGRYVAVYGNGMVSTGLGTWNRLLAFATWTAIVSYFSVFAPNGPRTVSGLRKRNCIRNRLGGNIGNRTRITSGDGSKLVECRFWKKAQ